MRLAGFCVCLFLCCAVVGSARAQDEDVLPEGVRSFMNGLVGSWVYEGSYGEQSIRGEWIVSWAPGDHCLVYQDSGVVGEEEETSRKYTGTGTACYDPSTEEFVEVIHYSDGNHVTNRHPVPREAADGLLVTGEQSTVQRDGTKKAGKIQWEFKDKNTQSYSVTGGENSLDAVFRRKEASTSGKSVMGAWCRVDEDGKEVGGVKFIMSDRWGVTYRDPATRVVQASHGGTYTLDGDKYAETIEYAVEDMKEYIGRTFGFQVRVEGDTLFLKGTNNPLDEVWKRVK